MLRSEKELAEYYRGRIESERKGLGPAPDFGAIGTGALSARRPSSDPRAKARVDFLSGLAAAAMAAGCLFAAPRLPNIGFMGAAETIAETRVDANEIIDFMRALGSSFISRQRNIGGQL